MASAAQTNQTIARAGIAAAAIAAIAAYGSGFGFWHFTIAFLVIAAALVLATVTVVRGIIALLRWRTISLSGFAGLVAALGLLGVMGYWIGRGVTAPPLHDVSTDVMNPPAFTRLSLRADNLQGVDTIENWRALHRAAFRDLTPVVIAKPVPEVMAMLKALVEKRGWEIALADATRIEATETQSPFQFKDDIIIVGTPVDGGQSTQIDIRSVSRVGLSDLGVNAQRIRSLLADITAVQ